MAEGGDNDNYDSLSYSNYLDASDETSVDVESMNHATSSRPDLFNNDKILNCDQNNATASSSGTTSRREDNPFSFKHFLNRDANASTAGNNYYQTGARPKVFSTNRQHSLPTSDLQGSTSPLNSDPPVRMASVDSGARTDFPSVLPDFVQDHLVVEQCYLGGDGNNVDLDNLPDFTLNRSNENQRLWSQDPSDNDNSNDLTFNLTNQRRNRVGFPLDLPLADTRNEDISSVSSGHRSCPQSGEVGVSKSLPDFLSDGPIHSTNRHSNITRSTNESPSAPGAPVISEPETTTSNSNSRDSDRWLRDELEQLRQQLNRRNRTIEVLERDLAAMRRKEEIYMDELSKSMEQVEGNLNISNKRAINAESSLAKIKQENKSLKCELAALRRENRLLRDNVGEAVGGPSSIRSHSSRQEQTSRRLAQELRGAASTAEQSLRSLLNGLTNLRVIATSLENLHDDDNSSPQHHDSFLSNVDDEPGAPL